MKLLRIEDGRGEYLAATGEFQPVDKVTKEDLLRLARAAIDNEQTEIDPFSDDVIKNHAHQIVYRSLSQKLLALVARRAEFLDEEARLYLAEYNGYGGMSDPQDGKNVGHD